MLSGNYIKPDARDAGTWKTREAPHTEQIFWSFAAAGHRPVCMRSGAVARVLAHSPAGGQAGSSCGQSNEVSVSCKGAP
jgi:hypothetical protein